MIPARTTSLLCAAALLALLTAPAFAQVTLPSVFSDHMVMQRKQANKVWGKAAPGEKVTVTIGTQSKDATAAADGAWQVMLDPMEAGEPLKLTAKAASGEAAFNDVLVGEVWICSGQSNMAYGLSQAYDGDMEVAAANHPQIRMITIPTRGSQTPIWTQPNAKWNICTPQTAGRFTAVGYYFARQVHETLNVPVGIINNSWSGSRGEAWIDRKYFEGHPNLIPLVERYDNFAKEMAELEAKGAQVPSTLRDNVTGDDRPANAWNGIVASHAGYGIKGVLWYQGEGNAPRGHQYRELLPVLIDSWRKEWNEGDFPFYFVQLPGNDPFKPEPGDSTWAELRESQTMTAANVKNTAEAVTIDLAEDGNLHPRAKKDVGLRLARIALARDYGIQMAWQSPTYKSMKIDGNRISLTFNTPNGNLRTLNGDAPRGFAIAGEDHKFYWADTAVNGDGSLAVFSDKVTTPAAVRYAWANNPICNIYDNARLPLTPFRTDTWKLSTEGILVH